MTGPALSPERWARVQEVFLDALERDGPEREAFLAAACGGDAALRAEVDSLLAAESRRGVVDRPLRVPPSAPPAVPPPEASPPGSLRFVGPYRLVVELGHGGMGTVWLAEREGEGFTQRVALKLLRSDYAGTRVAAQLEAERRILARLEHPGIARFIDGGTTPSRQPYIAMEYVDGTPLLAYCDRQGLDARRRVALFVEVCDAVQYAHGQLVVHRDLKPGNVLVTRDGVPKLLDFGVATVLSEGPATSPQTTNWLTPAYASPEQLRGERVTALTDVYALGVILYELVAGARPHDLGDGSWDAIVRAVTEATPERPSARAREAGRPLPKAQAADLDVITLKALAGDPARRYASAAQLGDDLRRWLRGAPVRAQPDSLGYRARTFVRRHRTLVGLTAVAFLSLAGGIAATAWQARIAGHERDLAREALARSEDVTAFLMGLFEAADPAGGADTATSRALLQAGLQRVDELADQPLVQAAMLDALGRVQTSLGSYPAAAGLYERALALREAAAGPADPELTGSLRGLADVRRRQARYPEAEALLGRALAIEEARFGAGALETAATLSDLGFLMPYLGRVAQSESLYRVVEGIQEAHYGPDDLRTMNTRLIVAVRLRGRDPEQAEAMLRDLMARSVGTAERDLFRAHVMLRLGDHLANRAGPGDLAEAERIYQEVLALQRSRVGDRSLMLIHGLGALADLQARRGAYAEAMALIEEANAINRALLGPNHPAVLLAANGVGMVLEQEGRYAEAAAMRRQSLAEIRRVLGDDHVLVAGVSADVARLEMLQGNLAEAERLTREALALRLRLHGPDHHLVQVNRAQLAVILARQGRIAEAEVEAREALAKLEATLPGDHELVRRARDAVEEVERRKAG